MIIVAMSSSLFASYLPSLLRAAENTPTRHFIDFAAWSDDNTPPILTTFRNQSILQMCRAYYQGELCLVKGFNRWEGTGSIVCNENISKCVVLNDTRRVNGAIVFMDGTREERENCWILGYEPLKNIKKVTNVYRVTDLSGVVRDETVCPCCLEDLSGAVVKCVNSHSVCSLCYGFLSTPKTCPSCRGSYSTRVLLRSESEIFFKNHDVFLGSISRKMREYSTATQEQKILLESFWYYCLNVEHRAFIAPESPVLKITNIGREIAYSMEVPDPEEMGNLYESFAIWFFKEGRERLTKSMGFTIYESQLKDDKMIGILRRQFGAEEALRMLQEAGTFQERNALRKSAWVYDLYQQLDDYDRTKNVLTLLKSAMIVLISSIVGAGESSHHIKRIEEEIISTDE